MRTLLSILLLIYLPSVVGEEVKKTSAQDIAAQLKQLESQVAADWAEYDKRPKIAFVSLASPPPFKDYVTAAARHIENVARLNYPVELKGIYGTVQVTIEVSPDGQVAEVQVNKSSGVRLLDEAAVSLAKEASPFPPFDEKFKSRVDRLYLVFPFSFTKEDMSSLTLRSSGTAQKRAAP